MNKKIYSLAGKLLKITVALFIFSIVFKIAIEAYSYVAHSFSQEHLEEEILEDYNDELYSLLNDKDVSTDDILKITNHYNRKSDNKFKEVGYSVILEDFFVKNLNSIHNSPVFIENLEDVKKIIDSHRKTINVNE